MRIIIAGGGPAAVEAAITIRQYDQTSSIDLYSAEDVLPYRRPLLPRVLASEISSEYLIIYPAEFYAANKINIHLARPIEKIDPSSQNVFLPDKEVVPYDRLLLAIGQKSRQLKVSDNVQSKVLSVHDIANVRKINSLLKNAAEVTVVGGGILGLECADALLKRNFRVNLIEQNSTIINGILDSNSALFLQQLLLEYNKNLTIYSECKLKDISLQAGGKAACVLSNPDNKVVYSDLVISAIGLEPHRDWGFELNTNHFLQICKCRNIFGAGDCVTVCGRKNRFYKEARMQGRIAGANIAGQSLEYTFPIAECRSMFNNIPFYCAGVIDPAQTECLSEYNGKQLKKLFYKLDRLVGCVLIGNTQDAGDLYTIIQKHRQDLR